MEYERVGRNLKAKSQSKLQEKADVFKATSVAKRGDYMDEKWRALRAEVLTRDGNVCRMCRTTWQLQVHHTRYIKYGRIWDSPISDLVTLCDDCHKKIHGIMSGRDEQAKKKKKRRRR